MIRYGKLSSASHNRLEIAWAFIHVIHTQHIRDENTVELSLFKNLCKFNPVFNILVFLRPVLRVSPEAYSTKSAACLILYNYRRFLISILLGPEF
jgi:hypothetical protein